MCAPALLTWALLALATGANAAVLPCIRPTSKLGVNLLGNSGAETGICSNNPYPYPFPQACWKGYAVIECYGSPNYQFPDSTTPGPAARGSGFFYGGASYYASLSQTVNVPAGARTFTFSAFLGGKSYNDDYVLAKVVFFSKTACLTVLKAFTLPLVKSDQRNSVTALLLRTVSAAVPAGAGRAEVSLEFNRVDGSYCFGFADNISLVFK